MTHSVPSTHSIPVELYHPILSHLNLPSLLTLSTLSHTLHFESQRIIYASIDLRQRTYAQIRLWAETIAGDSRLARLVRTLVLPETIKWTYKISSWEVMEFRKILAGALKAVPNLVELTIVSQQGMRRGNPYLGLWMLEGCPFRLKKFHNGGDALYYPGRSSQFYIEQTEIRDWVPGYLEIGARIPEYVPDFSSSSRIFPHLEKIHLRDPKLLPILNQRPLTSITIDTTRHGITEREALWLLDILGVYHRNLVELRFITEGPSDAPSDGIMESGWWEPMNMVRYIPEKLPMLKVLGYSQLPSNYAEAGCDLPSFLQVLPRFKHLTTITIDPLSTASLATHPLGANARATDNESIAQRIFDACPSLSRVAFSFSSQGSWRAGRCPAFRRDGEGVLLEGFDDGCVQVGYKTIYFYDLL